MRIWPSKDKKYVHKPHSRRSWGSYYKRLKKVYPLYYFWRKVVVSEVMYRMARLRDVKYWIMYRIIPKHKYHILDSKLKPGYYNFDTVILHAAFERFIEEWPTTKEIILVPKKISKELDRLMNWWKIDRPAAEKCLEDIRREWHSRHRNTDYEYTLGVNLEKKPEVKISKKYKAETERLIKEAIRLDTELDNENSKNLLSLIKLKNHVSW